MSRADGDKVAGCLCSLVAIGYHFFEVRPIKMKRPLFFRFRIDVLKRVFIEDRNILDSLVFATLDYLLQTGYCCVHLHSWLDSNQRLSGFKFTATTPIAQPCYRFSPLTHKIG